MAFRGELAESRGRDAAGLELQAEPEDVDAPVVVSAVQGGVRLSDGFLRVLKRRGGLGAVLTERPEPFR